MLPDEKPRGLLLCMKPFFFLQHKKGNSVGIGLRSPVDQKKRSAEKPYSDLYRSTRLNWLLCAVCCVLCHLESFCGTGLSLESSFEAQVSIGAMSVSTRSKTKGPVPP